MAYFSEDDIQALASDNLKDKMRVQQHFLGLHKTIYKHLQDNDFDLTITKPMASAVHSETVSHHSDNSTLAIQYMRKREQAVPVERLMGREGVVSVNNIITRLHPVIEMRLSDTGFAIEFIISPDAWYDQQNAQGKLTVPRHRQEFYSILANLDETHYMGFWQGTHLSDMTLNGKFFPHTRILNEWLSTFHPNADWFRIGKWYALDDEALSSDRIVAELIEQFEVLYPIYRFFLWTSGNNFREFGDS